MINRKKYLHYCRTECENNNLKCSFESFVSIFLSKVYHYGNIVALMEIYHTYLFDIFYVVILISSTFTIFHDQYLNFKFNLTWKSNKSCSIKLIISHSCKNIHVRCILGTQEIVTRKNVNKITINQILQCYEAFYALAEHCFMVSNNKLDF